MYCPSLTKITPVKNGSRGPHDVMGMGITGTLMLKTRLIISKGGELSCFRHRGTLLKTYLTKILTGTYRLMNYSTFDQGMSIQ